MDPMSLLSHFRRSLVEASPRTAGRALNPYYYGYFAALADTD